MEKKICFENDSLAIWNSTNFVFTLDLISKITGIEIPEYFLGVRQEEVSDMSHSLFLPNAHKKGLRVLFMWVYQEKMHKTYLEYIRDGVVIITCDEVTKKHADLQPAISLKRIEDVRNAWLALGLYLQRIIDLPTIGITGSVGKTTLTMFLKCIFSERFNVFTSAGNQNTAVYIVREMLRKYSPEYDIHIQECGGGFPGRVERSVKFLQPEAFIISNILPHHLDKYNDLEGVLADKASFDHYSKESAFGVINIDDDMLRNYPFKHRIVTCGIEHQEADYIAKNIHFEKNLCLDVEHAGETTTLHINIPGIHNAYNALLAFAMAKEWGFSNEEIKHGLSKYESGDIRQNLKEIAGRTLYIDCFNICADSIHSCLAVLNSMSKQKGKKKIAFIGGENDLGEKLYDVNYNVGLNLKQYEDIDKFIFVGLPTGSSLDEMNSIGDGYAVYQGAKKVLPNNKISYVDNLDEVARILSNETKPGDIVLLKAVFRIPLFTALDNALGTSYTTSSPYVDKTSIAEGLFTAKSYPRLNDRCNITSCKKVGKHLVIPNAIGNSPVFRIGEGVFKNKTKITTVDFGTSVVNIGREAFSGCTGMKRLNLPTNVIQLEKRAFADCAQLESVKLPGVIHIDSEVFVNCRKLNKVTISHSCAFIGEDAFAGCDNLTIYAPPRSYAERYAQEHGIAVCDLKKKSLRSKIKQHLRKKFS